MEEAYDHIEAGLDAFEKLILCTQKFPKFNLDEELDTVYEDLAIVKDFVKWGVKFVKNYQIDANDTVDINAELSQFSNECQKDSLEGKGDKTDTTTPVVSKEAGTMKTKKKRKQKRRQERLLKFQEQLVTTSGLPPSKLMEKRLSQSLSGLDKVKMSLSGEFEQIGKVETGPEPGTVPVQHASITAPVLMPGHPAVHHVPPPAPVLESQMPTSVLMPGQTAENSHILQNVTSSGFLPLPTLCSSPVSLNTPPPTTSGLCYGSNSGFSNQPSLPSSQQTVQWVWNIPFTLFPHQPVTPPQPQPELVPGKPAYCFHCLQLGTVFNIIPAYILIKRTCYVFTTMEA